jgi:phosphoribosyl-ATP pyrophosphohydrolase
MIRERPDLEGAIGRLADGVRKATEDRNPRTAKLLASGPTRIAQKLGEEAIEVSLELALGRREGVIRESADLLYQLVVGWTAMGILPDEILWEMRKRELALGLAEKLPKPAGGGT